MVHSPSKHQSIQNIEQILRDNGIAQSGKEYSVEELRMFRMAKLEAKAERLAARRLKELQAPKRQRKPRSTLKDYFPLPEKPNQSKKKQSTRMLKVECRACGYIARTSSKWLEIQGAPICPCNYLPMEEVGKKQTPVKCDI